MLKQHRWFSGKMLACHAGGPGSIPRRCSSIFGIWREVLGHNVYITSHYFFPAIIYRDIISHITITYRYIMYFFRTFKKSTAPYKVHNMGLRYRIFNSNLELRNLVCSCEREWESDRSFIWGQRERVGGTWNTGWNLHGSVPSYTLHHIGWF